MGLLILTFQLAHDETGCKCQLIIFVVERAVHAALIMLSSVI